MLKNALKITSIIGLTFAIAACKKSNNNQALSGFDNLLISTNITTSNPVVGYFGTAKDLSIGNFTNSKSIQSTMYPYITVNNGDVYTMQYYFGDMVKKYTRQPDGTLSQVGSFTAPAASAPSSVVVENSTRAYCALFNAGKIIVFNPSTMTITSTIDLTSYALGDGSPDPNVMAFRNGKLYVVCSQTADKSTSKYPAQVLIIDVNNNFSIISTTDNRSNWAGSFNELKSIFFDENGDLYVYCVASYGFVPGQKSGFLRIKNGQNTFDPDYFFNTTDYTIADIPGNSINYLQRMRYTKNGVVYANANITALASSPPDYVKDRTYGAFKVDIYNKTISKINLPYSAGYALGVGLYDDKVLFGISGNTAVGIYSYDTTTQTASSAPVITTQGDPSFNEKF